MSEITCEEVIMIKSMKQSLFAIGLAVYVSSTAVAFYISEAEEPRANDEINEELMVQN